MNVDKIIEEKTTLEKSLAKALILLRKAFVPVDYWDHNGNLSLEINAFLKEHNCEVKMSN